MDRVLIKELLSCILGVLTMTILKSAIFPSMAAETYRALRDQDFLDRTSMTKDEVQNDKDRAPTDFRKIPEF